MASGKRKRIMEPILEESPSRFFKIMLPSSLQGKKLRIPQKFVRKFGHELFAAATLITPNGSDWQVGFTKDEKNVWFHDGWHDFVQYHSIFAGYLLVFEYQRNSKFHVLIFDLTACEISYPSKGEDSKSDKQNSEFQDDMKSEHCGFVTSRRMLFSRMNSLPEHLDWAKETFGPPRQVQRNCKSIVLGKSKVEHEFELQSKKGKKMEETMKINKPDCNKEYDLLALLEEKEICSTPQCRHVLLAKGSERVMNIFQSFKLKNPSFLIILQSSNQSLYHVYISTKFVEKCSIYDAKSIKVQVSDGKEWCIRVYRKQCGDLYLKGGWDKLVKANKLKEGNICVFELIRKKPLLLKLSVFHA